MTSNGGWIKQLVTRRRDLSSDHLVSSSPLAQTHSSTNSAKLFPPTSPLTPTRGFHHAKLAFSEQVVDVHVASEREKSDEEERKRKVESEMEFDLRRKKSKLSFVVWAKQDDENEDGKTEAVEKEAEEKGEEMDGRQNPLLPQLLPPSLFSRSTSKLAHPRSHQVEWCVNKQYENKKRQDELSVLKENRNIRNRSQHHLLTRSVKPKRRKEFTRMTRKKGTGLMEEGSVEVQKRRMMNTGRGSAGSARPRTPRIADLEKAGRKGGLAEGEEKAEVKENKLVEPVQTSRLVDGNVWVRKKEVTLTNEMRNLAEWTEKQGEKKEQDKLRMWWNEQSELSDCSDDDGLFEVYKGEGRTDWGRRSILVSLPQPNTLDEIAEPTDSALLTLHFRWIKLG
ncbi:hypothetical protein BLNAU_7413 [Blattamonas nauphoetae]|uniref:Uncharacterized protein n=1 Tax=Blattamonas nauphoetae TaxID=2049346 RepID=A0ABQ9Y1E2_9EUKA|nr:hypothetical protein BLNAU_7413 [Blattamonas nauphoetae]